MLPERILMRNCHQLHEIEFGKNNRLRDIILPAKPNTINWDFIWHTHFVLSRKGFIGLDKW
jgi:hypothetical protein